MRLYQFIIVAIVLFSQNANAYIDPGTTNYIFQLAIAGLVGGLFVVKNYLRRLFSYFINLKRKFLENKN